MPNDPSKTDAGAELERFERVLARAPFEGLKALLERLTPDRHRLCAAVLGASSFVDLLAKLGYQLTVTRQIHVQDCYSRLGPEGGIKAVLPYYDIPTQSSLPTLVNFDATVTATPKSAAFFEALLLDLRTQLSAPS
jgi:hypothetical protein